MRADRLKELYRRAMQLEVDFFSAQPNTPPARKYLPEFATDRAACSSASSFIGPLEPCLSSQQARNTSYTFAWPRSKIAWHPVGVKGHITFNSAAEDLLCCIAPSTVGIVLVATIMLHSIL